jgi:hypothetical protein
VYPLAAGDKDKSTTVSVKATVRPPTSQNPKGSSSFAIRLDTVMDVVDDTDGIISDDDHFDATISFNKDGVVLHDEDEILRILLALSSLVWSSVSAGEPQSGIIANLAYAITQVF